MLRSMGVAIKQIGSLHTSINDVYRPICPAYLQTHTNNKLTSIGLFREVFTGSCLPEMTVPKSNHHTETFYLAASLHSRACFKKNTSLHIWPKNFQRPLFRTLPQYNCAFYLSKF